jgi:hypothetical protein
VARRKGLKPFPLLDAMVEERELRFPPAAPLRAWRLFRVRAHAGGLVLFSPMYDDPDPTPWPRAKLAVCTEDHPAPAPGCRCGIYAVVRDTLDSLPGYLLDTAYDSDPPAYGEVACSGRVFVDARGVRAERVDVLRIALVKSSWADERSVAEAKRLLGERYGVPVGRLEEVPPWVTGNLRAGGPPPDGVTIDLDESVARLAGGRATRAEARGPRAGS